MASSVPVQVLNQFSIIPDVAYQGGVRNSAYAMQFVTRTQVESAPNSSIGHIYTVNGTFSPQPGKAAVIRGFYFKSTKRVTIQVRAGVGVNALQNVNIPEMDLTDVVDNTGTYISCDWIVRNGRSVFIYCLNFMDSGDIDTWLSITPDVYYITDDFNFAAKKCFNWIGTSITNGSGPTSTAFMYHTLVKDYIRRQGVSLRHELNGISGSTSTVHFTIFGQGGYDLVSSGIPQDVTIIELAVNDASAPIPVNTSVSNITSYLNRMLNHPENPKMIVIVLGATPLENNTANANAITFDTQISSLVATYAANPLYTNRVFFVPLSASFNRLDTTKYASSDTPGQRIHPSDSGSADIFTNGFLPFLQSASGLLIIDALK